MNIKYVRITGVFTFSIGIIAMVVFQILHSAFGQLQPSATHTEAVTLSDKTYFFTPLMNSTVKATYWTAMVSLVCTLPCIVVIGIVQHSERKKQTKT